MQANLRRFNWQTESKAQQPIIDFGTSVNKIRLGLRALSDSKDPLAQGYSRVLQCFLAEHEPDFHSALLRESVQASQTADPTTILYSFAELCTAVADNRSDWQRLPWIDVQDGIGWVVNFDPPASQALLSIRSLLQPLAQAAEALPFLSVVANTLGQAELLQTVEPVYLSNEKYCIELLSCAIQTKRDSRNFGAADVNAICLALALRQSFLGHLDRKACQNDQQSKELAEALCNYIQSLLKNPDQGDRDTLQKVLASFQHNPPTEWPPSVAELAAVTLPNKQKVFGPELEQLTDSHLTLWAAKLKERREGA
jgi:hypothetical protein